MKNRIINYILTAGIVAFSFISVNNFSLKEAKSDPELLEYVALFKEEATVRRINLSKEPILITFGETDPLNNWETQPYGVCYPTAGNKRIIIKKDLFESLTDPMKEMLVFHELGHCMLNRDHIELKNKYGISLSIMAANDFPDDYFYMENRAHYLSELFYGPSYIQRWNYDELE